MRYAHTAPHPMRTALSVAGVNPRNRGRVTFTRYTYSTPIRAIMRPKHKHCTTITVRAFGYTFKLYLRHG